jgi:large subunit ribosomal protein L2
MPGPKTPWGKPARGVRTRKRKHTDRYIIKRAEKKRRGKK